MADKTLVKSASPTPEQQQQTQGYLMLSEALQRAHQEGKLPAWKGEQDGQQIYIKELGANTEAIAEFNRWCKTEEKKRCANEFKSGNRGQRKAGHHPEVAIPQAVRVYNKHLQNYLDDGTLPMYSYKKVCADRDRYQEERDQAREEIEQKDQTIREKDEYILKLKQDIQDRDEYIRKLKQDIQEMAAGGPYSQVKEEEDGAKVQQESKIKKEPKEEADGAKVDEHNIKKEVKKEENGAKVHEGNIKEENEMDQLEKNFRH